MPGMGNQVAAASADEEDRPQAKVEVYQDDSGEYLVHISADEPRGAVLAAVIGPIVSDDASCGVDLLVDDVAYPLGEDGTAALDAFPRRQCSLRIQN